MPFSLIEMATRNVGVFLQ